MWGQVWRRRHKGSQVPVVNRSTRCYSFFGLELLSVPVDELFAVSPCQKYRI